MGLGVKSKVLKMLRGSPDAPAADAVAQYWTGHNVSNHRRFSSADDSLQYFRWRNAQYPHYIELMPVSGYSGTVLDYGCGPGHDLVGFAVYSKPQRLIGMDVSASSLAEAADRLAVHGAPVEFVNVAGRSALPLETASVDHIHSSGVLHHVENPVAILKELRRVLKPGGTMNVMVYNYDSIWLHLYVAYVKQIQEGLYAGESIREAFRHTTDGPDCPISNVYKPQEWIALCNEAGFTASFKGAAVSLWESHMLQQHRYMACMQENLREESRDFLLGLTFDENGFARTAGAYAGIDGCYALRPA